ncbi:hypothetical protein NX059_000473 [Plenodomus lindquistii]|nr:hypothetical protein NX059_000473 [Plenodomus lindquistii]
MLCGGRCLYGVLSMVLEYMKEEAILRRDVHAFAREDNEYNQLIQYMNAVSLSVMVFQMIQFFLMQGQGRCCTRQLQGGCAGSLLWRGGQQRQITVSQRQARRHETPITHAHFLLLQIQYANLTHHSLGLPPRILPDSDITVTSSDCGDPPAQTDVVLSALPLTRAERGGV